jgi:hypothetical protein
MGASFFAGRRLRAAVRLWLARTLAARALSAATGFRMQTAIRGALRGWRACIERAHAAAAQQKHLVALRAKQALRLWRAQAYDSAARMRRDEAAARVSVRARERQALHAWREVALDRPREEARLRERADVHQRRRLLHLALGPCFVLLHAPLFAWFSDRVVAHVSPVGRFLAFAVRVCMPAFLCLGSGVAELRAAERGLAEVPQAR